MCSSSFQIPFEEISVKLRQSDSKAALLAHSPAGKVPVLRDGDVLIWDSLAIIEYIADLYPDRPVWPRDRVARGIARAISRRNACRIPAIARSLPHGSVSPPNQWTAFPEGVEHNIRRIVQSFRDCRTEYGRDGPFLFGEFTAADAMYAPVCSRFRTYVPDLRSFGDDGTATDYVETIFAMPEMELWAAAARAESAPG